MPGMSEKNRDGLDARARETVRFWAVDQVKEAGAHPEQLALSLGLERKTIYKWLRADREGGREALLATRAPGAKSKLTGEQKRWVGTVVTECDPQSLGFANALWTRAMVQELIYSEFGIEVSLPTVGKILHELGLSPQRPLWRAYEADAGEVEKWKTERFPKIRDEAEAAGQVVYFADEAGVRSDYHAGTTWAPKGKTPVVRSTGARYRLNMLSAVCLDGTLRFEITQENVNAEIFIDFCKKVLADTKREAGKGVVMIVDGHGSHMAGEVNKWIASTGGEFVMHRLPGYSPQLNPDEWVWKHIKHDQIGRRSVKSKDQFLNLPKQALEDLAEQPQVIQGFFKDPDLAYITA